MPIIQGYTTQNNKFETLVDKELIKHDLLMQIYTPKGSLDWNPSYGTTIMDQLFQYKNEYTKSTIRDELSTIIDKNDFLTLVDANIKELDNGWIFYIDINYMDEGVETWTLTVTEEDAKEYLSNGSFPLK